MSKYKKAKEKWVKERLYEFNLYYREFRLGEFIDNHKICSWDSNFKTWYFPMHSKKLYGDLESIDNYFWFLGDNSIDKFYKIRKVIRGNNKFFISMQTYEGKAKEMDKKLEEVGLLDV